MCRICGRVVKCIFDTMPSRVHHVPSRRAFTTVRRLATPTSSVAKPIQSSTPSLTRAFSALSVRTTTSPFKSTTSSPLSTTTTRPSIPSVYASSRILPIYRSFSASAGLFGYRRRSDTYNPSRRVQKRRHGYLARLRSTGGVKVLKRRKLKLRKDLSY
ncbi:hypothetical protein EDD36DRAFT_434146 [Exophiala viscosa]|uniref:Ribosomal protein L34 n=2 Tax=Exophiala viscosa TaxID=2486360 RepID=A0AAN6IFI7_9EURO|nr:hypothetical protein EDD36DRAFT_434146 [Exophiala viscosa]